MTSSLCLGTHPHLCLQPCEDWEGKKAEVSPQKAKYGMASVCRALGNQTRPMGRKGKKLQFGFCYVTWVAGVIGGKESGPGVALSFVPLN